MIQDISPDKLNNAYTPVVPCEEDLILFFDGDGRLLVRILDGRICFTTGREIPPDGAMYLFSVNAARFFLSFGGEKPMLPGYEYRSVRDLRDLCFRYFPQQKGFRT